jgi:hypothetical protein
MGNLQRIPRLLAGLIIGPLGRDQPIPRSLMRLLEKPLLNGVRSLRLVVACTCICHTDIIRVGMALRTLRAGGCRR